MASEQPNRRFYLAKACCLDNNRVVYDSWLTTTSQGLAIKSGVSESHRRTKSLLLKAPKIPQRWQGGSAGNSTGTENQTIIVHRQWIWAERRASRSRLRAECNSELHVG